MYSRRWVFKSMMVAIPTSSGTGSEVTPFAIITDATTGTKWPIADYELMPNMAIVDTDFMMTQPKGLTSASGIDASDPCLRGIRFYYGYRLYRRYGLKGSQTDL